MSLDEVKKKNASELTAEVIAEEQLNAYLEELENWGLDEKGKLTTNFELNNFMAAVTLLNTIAELAEEQNHHPDLIIYDYNNLIVTLFTHDANGITEKDIQMAAKIEEIAQELETN